MSAVTPIHFRCPDPTLLRLKKARSRTNVRWVIIDHIFASIVAINITALAQLHATDAAAYTAFRLLQVASPKIQRRWFLGKTLHFPFKKGNMVAIILHFMYWMNYGGFFPSLATKMPLFSLLRVQNAFIISNNFTLSFPHQTSVCSLTFSPYYVCLCLGYLSLLLSSVSLLSLVAIYSFYFPWLYFYLSWLFSGYL